MNKIQFKTRKEVSNFLKEKNIDTTNWTEEKWQSINTSQAEIHIQALAEAMWDSRNESTPNQLKAGEWHIPFGDRIDNLQLVESIGFKTTDYDWYMKELWSKIQISTARCARLSYMTFDNEINYKKDIALHDSLLASKHMSPFEHVAKCMSDEEYYSFFKGEIPISIESGGCICHQDYYPYAGNTELSNWLEFKGPNPNNEDRYGWCNNLKGFIQYRYLIENGNS